MAIVSRSVYELVDGVLEEGLNYAASYLESALNRSITVVDYNGQVHYPEKHPNAIDEMFERLPASILENRPFYDELNRTLYYPVEYSNTKAFVIVHKLPSKLVTQAISTLAEARLAIKCYFSNQNRAQKNQERFEKELIDYLVYQSPAKIKDIITMSELELDMQDPYFVTVIEFGEELADLEFHTIRAYSKEYLKHINSGIILLALSHAQVLIIPACSQGESPDIIAQSSRLFQVSRYRDLIEQRFNIMTSVGVGRIYSLGELKKSYNEACIAIAFPKQIGKSHFIQHFAKLGLYSLIFNQDFDTIRDYCINTLGPVLEYDEINNGELLTTLKKLLDCNFHLKTASDSLFIHVNTLYYRIGKIEQLLDLDLSEMGARSNLFTAIKVWDTLVALDRSLLAAH